MFGRIRRSDFVVEKTSRMGITKRPFSPESLLKYRRFFGFVTSIEEAQRGANLLPDSPKGLKPMFLCGFSGVLPCFDAVLLGTAKYPGCMCHRR